MNKHWVHSGGLFQARPIRSRNIAAAVGTASTSSELAWSVPLMSVR